MEEKSKTILIIEDESAVRESMTGYLEDREYTVLQAENGELGLEMINKLRPDLIMTDLRMPKLDGLEVLDYVQNHMPEIPIIVVSGTGQISDSVEALRSGAWDYIIKPINDLSIITIAVERALERANLLEERRNYQKNLEKLVLDRTIALQQANDQLSDINSRLRQIINSTSELAKCSDVKMFGTTLLNEFAKHMAATGGSLFFIEETGLRLLYTIQAERVPDFIPFPLSEGSILKRVLKEEKSLLIKNIKEDKDLILGGWKGYSNNSVLAFPLPDENGRIIGILTLHNKSSPPFVEQDKEIGLILASFSRETLRAIQNFEIIQKNADQQRTILNSLHTGVIVVEAKNRTIVDVNAEAVNLIGLPKNEIIGKECHVFLCPDKEQDCPLLESEGYLDNLETTLYTANQEEIPILKTAVPIHLNNQTHYLESFVDISRNKEMELEKEILQAQLIQAQKMEAVGTLAGGLAHDLNNALNGIIGPVSILLRQTKDDQDLPPDKLKKQLERIQYSGYRISDMVNQLMTVSQKQELSLTAVDLNQSIKHVVKLAKGTFDKSIEILPKLISTPASTKADPTQIEQLLLNLLINAAHAMTIMRPEGDKWGGTLEVEVTTISVDKAFIAIQADIEEGDYWMITVEDTGVGMTADELKKIFTPFFTSKEKGQGTGLGLAMAFNIVNQHQGKITVDSVKGVGTVFKVYLPRLTVAKDDKKQTIDHESLKGEGVVLIVDDEKNIRETTDEILVDFGYETLTAENGLDAVRLFKERHEAIDLILLDLIMPKMAGDEAFKELKKIDDSVPILLVSGFKQDERIQAVLKSNDVNFLQKPYDLYSLGAAVKKSIRESN